MRQPAVGLPVTALRSWLIRHVSLYVVLVTRPTGDSRAKPAAEHYAVRRTAGGCAIEEVLTGGNGQIQGIGLSGWDSDRKQWRQLWTDKDRIVTVYMGGPAADGTFVLTSEPKGAGTRWRYTYRNIRPDGVDAEYASRSGDDGPWTAVWSGHFDRIGPAEK